MLALSWAGSHTRDTGAKDVDEAQQLCAPARVLRCSSALDTGPRVRR